MKYIVDVSALLKALKQFFSRFVVPVKETTAPQETDASHTPTPPDPPAPTTGTEEVGVPSGEQPAPQTEEASPSEELPQPEATTPQPEVVPVVEQPPAPEEVVEMALPLKGVKIVVDPGHGGVKSGAVGLGGTMEKDIVLSIGKKVQKLLSDLGATTIMTRQSDVDVPISDRTTMANNAGANVFVSIHCNANANRVIHGMEVYHHGTSTKGPVLAQAVQDALAAQMSYRKNNGIKSDFLIYPDSGFAVLRDTSMVAILVETDYISHEATELQLKDSKVQDDFAQGIVNGLRKYLGK